MTQFQGWLLVILAVVGVSYLIARDHQPGPSALEQHESIMDRARAQGLID